MDSKNKQTNKTNESDASLTASKQADAPANASKVEGSSTNATTATEGGAVQNAPNSENATQEKSTDDQATKKTENRVQLSGAGRKRFKSLRKQGHSFEDARKLAVNANATRTGGGRNPRTASDDRDNRDSIRVVVKASKPGVSLTKNEQRLVQDGILKKIVEFKGDGVKPKFLGQAFRAGWMILTCANQSTLVWLRKIISQVKPWPGASLKVVTEAKDKIDPFVVVANFPLSLDDTSKAILGYIEAQNDGFITKHWKILNRLIEGTSVQLTLKLDKSSFDKLKSLNSKVCYKFGNVLFKPKEPQTRGNNPLSKSNIPARNLSGSLNRAGTLNRSRPRIDITTRPGRPDRNDSGPIRNRTIARPNRGVPSSRGPLNNSSGRLDLFSRQGGGSSRGVNGGDQGRGNNYNISRNSSIPNPLSEFANNIDKLRSLMQQQQPQPNNDYQMFSRRSDNNNPSRTNNDNYDSSYGISNQNYGNSNFRDQGFQNNSDFRDTPNYGGNSSGFSGNSGFSNNPGNSLSNNFRTPSNFGNNNLNDYGNSSSNFGPSNYGSSNFGNSSFGNSSLGNSNFDNNSNYESSSQNLFGRRYDPPSRSSLIGTGGSGGWYRR